MTDARTGLRSKLARNAGISQLTTEELIAQMTDEQKTAIAASLAPAPAPAAKAEAMEPEGDEEEGEDGKKMMPKSKGEGDDDMGDEDAKAKAATERAVAVMSSEHAVGRMEQAGKLLANDKLSADEIISVLSVAASSTTPADPEAAARADMQAALKENANTVIEANDGGGQKPASKAADVWAAAHAKVFGSNTPA